MKIVSWNCNMAFRKKANQILAEDPTILIVPECENLDRLDVDSMIQKPSDMFWFGDNPNKGLGVFTFDNYKIEKLNVHNPEFRFILPLKISNPDQTFIVFAVWTQKPSTNDFYVAQIWNALNYYSEILQEENIIIAGDFNSNSIWDKPRKLATHGNTVAFLKEREITSAYHHFHELDHGKEKHMTHHLQRKIEKGFHIDYCFVSSSFINKLQSVSVGDYETWSLLSDHNPLIVEIQD